MANDTPVSVGETHRLALSALLGDHKVAAPGSAAYGTAQGSYFSAQQRALQPACIVAPTTAEEVSAAVVALTASEAAPAFAVRSGGHMYWAGASNIAGGTVIDLRGLNAIEVSADHSTVSIGVGATWDAVYAKLDPLGVTVAGGRAAQVGVGGLVLGGGISYHSPRFGWTCDTVVNFQVVLADGSIVDANATQNADLFVALRGASNNFGIVTRIDMATFEGGKIFAAAVVGPISTADAQIDEFVKINSADAYDEYASLMTSFAYSGQQKMMVVSNEFEYTKPDENPAVFQTMLDLPSFFKNARLTTMTEVAHTTLALQPKTPRSLSMVLTLSSTVPSLKAAFQQWERSVPSIQQVADVTWSLTLEPLPPAIYARGGKDNALGLADRGTTPLVVALLSARWSDPADDEHIATAAQALMDAIEHDARSLGAYDPFIYLNYAGQGQDAIASYGAESLEKLRQVRERVDPNWVFTRQVPGGYKIPAV
ncbi:hypothetical protein B0T22DRAFT_460912 [Podospora appendiculata]|uniref:FAD-binding PCMH-type domain-containing protein n=1 Tax=Podospora appendiculata TaxID=314037 RepID=A0AAE0XAM9_9PEZI|nr:hypothetical protein B0T22DRAFT_460912 [Podospora appendiculata]